mmetsp:Transcript_6206/g.25134  ORF Transcript_6206/g.25134 Transcript_6206/m.25134 type:complete len:261 (-) Transcript_6206:271-1053(-)
MPSMRTSFFTEKSNSGGSFRLNSTMRVPVGVVILSSSRSTAASDAKYVYCSMTLMFSSHSAVLLGSLATYVCFPAPPAVSVVQVNIGMRMSSASIALRNVVDRSAALAWPSRLERINASCAMRIDPDLNPMPNRPTLPTTCSLLENPNESMQCKFERAMPTPSSCTESAIFPGSNSNASTSTRVAPHSWSCALSRSSARAPRGQTCDVALLSNMRGWLFEWESTLWRAGSGAVTKRGPSSAAYVASGGPSVAPSAPAISC